MLTVQKLAFLSRIELFSGMSSKELGHIAAIAEEIVYPARTEIFREGDYGDYMLLVVEGEVKIHHGDKELMICQKNDYFGEMTLLDGEPRSASASTLTDCLMLRVNQANFHDILSGNFEAVLAIMRTLTQRLRKREEELWKLTRK
ncbi:cyclic nucleotide-binding domain-containing protein [Acidobacteriota bacterium]